jgi:Tfp pilus assembly protein PilF
MRGALKELLDAVKLDPEAANTHNALGLVYHRLEHLDKGLFHYNKAVEYREVFSEAYNNRGVLLMDIGRYDEAIESFGIALGDILYRTPASAEGNMGWAYYKKGDIKEGLKHIRNAVAINTKFCRGYEWLVRISLSQDDVEAVESDYRRFERYCASDKEVAKLISPDYKRQMQYYYALALLKRGDLKRARDLLGECSTEDLDAYFGTKCSTTLKAL